MAWINYMKPAVTQFSEKTYVKIGRFDQKSKFYTL